MKTETKTYESPRILKAVHFEGGLSILAGSAPVQPGGGGGGSITVEDPDEDNDDTQIIGARKSDFSFDWH